MHEQKKMFWITQATEHNYFCFVIWKERSEGLKDYVIIDIRTFNNIMKDDLYSLLFQSNIIELVAECSFIITIDAAFYFHQFMIKEKDCYKFTVISHWGQELFNVALIEYKGSSLYVQWQTDKILQKHCVYVKAYIDDIIIFFKTFAEHFEHL